MYINEDLMGLKSWYLQSPEGKDQTGNIKKSP